MHSGPKQRVIVYALGIALVHLACSSSERMTAADREVVLLSHRVDFGRVKTGASRVSEIPVRNTGRAPVRVVVDASAPFGGTGEITIPGGADSQIPVEVRVQSSGAQSATMRLLLDNGQAPLEVQLAVTGMDLEDCPPPAVSCEERFLSEDGSCGVRPLADGTACTDACLVNATCHAGACVGEARSCDDGVSCTSDACDVQLGCVHMAVDELCGEATACSTPRCDATSGCTTDFQPDGTTCGLSDCEGARVCMSGSCRYVERADWRAEPPCSTTCQEGCPIPGFLLDGVAACALKKDGTVWCAGDNRKGWIGDPGFTGDFSSSFRQVNNLPPVRQISKHGDPCVVTELGSVFCWGNNAVFYRDDQGIIHYEQFGILGTGDSVSPIIRQPQQVPGLEDVVQVESSYDSHCALKRDGTVWCWGLNTRGLLGLGFTSSRTSNPTFPVQMPGVTDAVEISLFRAGCLRRRPGQMLCWGYHLPPAPSEILPPTPVEGFPPFARTFADNEFTSGLDAEGNLYFVWSSPMALFYGIPGRLEVPERVASAGDQNASGGCAVPVSGDLWCWGTNWYGELGLGVRDGAPEFCYGGQCPVRPPFKHPSLSDVVWIRGSSTKCVGLKDGTVKCMGWAGPEGLGWFGKGESYVTMPNAVTF